MGSDQRCRTDTMATKESVMLKARTRSWRRELIGNRFFHSTGSKLMFESRSNQGLLRALNRESVMLNNQAFFVFCFTLPFRISFLFVTSDLPEQQLWSGGDFIQQREKKPFCERSPFALTEAESRRDDPTKQVACPKSAHPPKSDLI